MGIKLQSFMIAVYDIKLTKANTYWHIHRHRRHHRSTFELKLKIKFFCFKLRKNSGGVIGGMPHRRTRRIRHLCFWFGLLTSFHFLINTNKAYLFILLIVLKLNNYFKKFTNNKFLIFIFSLRPYELRIKWSFNDQRVN